jgi:hypothetical protein
VSDLGDLIPALVDLYTGKAGLTTVRATVPPTDPEQADLPMLFFDVLGASTESTSHRRTMIWPIDIYLLVTVKTQDVATDVPLVYPWPERLIGWLDEHVTLNGLLAASVRWPSPAMDDIAPIRMRTKTYLGCLLHPMFPLKLERTFSP